MISGNGGKMTLGGSALDVEEWAIEGEIPDIESTQGGDLVSAFDGGRPVVRGTCSVRFDANAKTKLLPMITGATPASAKATAILYMDGTQNLTGTVKLSRIGMAVAVLNNEWIKVPCSFVFSGAITVT